MNDTNPRLREDEFVEAVRQHCGDAVAAAAHRLAHGDEGWKENLNDKEIRSIRLLIESTGFELPANLRTQATLDLHSPSSLTAARFTS